MSTVKPNRAISYNFGLLFTKGVFKMNSLSDYINVEELREIVRLFAHQLLMGYEDTHEENFWLISEKLAEIYECLLPYVPPQQAKSKKTKFPKDYWTLQNNDNTI